MLRTLPSPPRSLNPSRTRPQLLSTAHAEAGDKVRVAELSREQASPLGLLTKASGASASTAPLLQLAATAQVGCRTGHPAHQGSSLGQVVAWLWR